MFTPSFGYYFRRNAFCCGVDNESETLGPGSDPSPVLAVSVTYRKCSEVSDASLEGKQAFSCGVDNESEKFVSSSEVNLSLQCQKCPDILEGKQAFSCGVDNKSETLGPRSDASSGK